MIRHMWALTTEFWRTHWLQVVGTMLPPMLLPILLYGPLFFLSKGGWQHDSSTVMMHIVLTGIIALCGVGTLLTWFDSLHREYTLPITTWELVATRSTGGGSVAAASYALACLMANWLFRVDWPLLGPLLVAIAVYLAAQAAYLLTMKSHALGLLLFAPLGLISAWWFAARYETGELAGGQLRMWSRITWDEWFTLLLVSVGGVLGSYYAARLQRMGSGPTMAGWVTLLFEETRRSGPAAPPNFTNYQAALSWREWRERGRAIPWLFAAAALIYGCLWLVLPLRAQEAVEMGGGFSMLGAVSFLAWGIYLGTRSKGQAFLSFDATRPVTDA